MTEQSVNNQIAKGAVWMMALRMGVKLIGLVSTVILARLLTPEDFGLVALAMSIYAMVELLREFGFDTVLINKQSAGREYYDTAWTLQIGFSLLAATIVLILSPFFTNLYGDERLLPILWVMALILVINGFNNIGVVEFRKQMHFNREFLYIILIKISGFSVTIPLAFYLRSYWALIFGMASTQFVSLVLGYAMQSFRPRLRITVWREILGFSSFLFLNNILYYLNQHGQNLIIAKLAGTSSLGIYSVSSEIATITSSEVVASINRAAYPGFAKLSDNISELRKTYLKVLSNIVMIALPSGLGIFAVAPILVSVLLGEKWLDAIPIIQILAIASMFISISTNSTYVYLATSRQKITTVLTMVQLILFFSLLLILIPKYSITGVAYAMLVTNIILLPVYQLIVNRILSININELLSVGYRPIIASLIMGYATSSYTNYFGNQTLDIFGIAVLTGAVLVGATIYFLSLLMLWALAGSPDGAEARILSLIVIRIKNDAT